MAAARQPWAARIAVALCCALLAACASRAPLRDAVVTGVVLARERIVLPPGAVFEATLLDLSDPDRPPVVLGRQRRADVGPPPYALWLAYPAQRFVSGGRYEVRAGVTLAGRLLLSTGARHPVPQDPAYRHVDLLLERTGQHPENADAAVPLAQTWWRLSAIEGTPLPGPASGVPPHLVLQPDARRASGSGGCNRFVADYRLQGAALQFGRLTTGIALCLPGSALENRFFAALAAVQGFRQQERQLLLLDAKGQTLLRLEAAQTGLTG